MTLLRGRPRLATKTDATQLGLFPQPDRIDDPTPIARVLIVGVEDALARRRAVPSRVIRLDRKVGARFVPEWELRASELEPAFWICDITPSALDRRVLFETLTSEVVEQDAAGRLWLDDQPLLPESLIAFGSAASRWDGELVIGERAALLLGSEARNGREIRLRLTTPVLWIHDLPFVRGRPVPLPGWMTLIAREAAVR
jgi:hypothetical protein